MMTSDNDEENGLLNGLWNDSWNEQCMPIINEWL